MTTAINTRLTAKDFQRQYADIDFCELERAEVVRCKRPANCVPFEVTPKFGVR